MLEFAAKSPNIQKIKSTQLTEKLNDIKSIDVFYPGIGDNLDFIKKFQLKEVDLALMLLMAKKMFPLKALF